MTRMLTGRGFALVLLCGLALLHVAGIARNWADKMTVRYQAAYVVGAGIREYLPAGTEISELMVAEVKRVADGAARDVQVSRHNVLVGVERASDADRIYVDVVLHSNAAWDSAFVQLCTALADASWQRKIASDRLHSAEVTRPPLSKATCRKLPPDPADQYPAEPHELLFVRAVATRTSSARITALDVISLGVLLGAIATWLPRRSRSATQQAPKRFEQNP
jgi:hypothetical protein